MTLGRVALVLAASLHIPADVAKRIEPGSSPHVLLARTSGATRAVGADKPAVGLSGDDWTHIGRAVQKSGYHARPMATPGRSSALEASNRRQAYHITFRHDGIELVPYASSTSWRLGVSVTGYGYEGDVRPLKPAEPRALRERVEYRRGPVTEWYVNRPSGLEQGFELEEPRPRRVGPLIIAMAVQGDLEASAHGRGISFAARSEKTLVRYAGLEAWDADGRPLRARLEAAEREIRLIVEADDARFPVTVDPTFVQEAQLFGHGDGMPPANADFGRSVAVSGDTAVVGMPLDDTGSGTDAGSASVFIRSGTVWTLQQRLEAADGSLGAEFGGAVSISGDTLVVGAPSDATGSVYVYVRLGTTWTLQQKLTVPGGFGFFGNSVSLFGDTVVIGTPGGIDPGVAYVFVRSGTVWTQQQALLASDAAAADFFGASVSLSGDTAVVGAPFDDNAGGGNAGAAYVFVRTGTVWTEQQKILASDGAAGDVFGDSVSVSGDTVVVASPSDDNAGGMDAGSAYVFLRSGTTWSPQEKLLSPDGAAFAYFGIAVSLSGDTLVAAAPYADIPGGGDAGAAYVFGRAGTVWTLEQKLLATDGAGGDLFGSSLSLSGETVMVGAPADDTPTALDAGSAYVFVRVGTTWTEQQKLLGSEIAASGDSFGDSVSISGETVVIGAPQDHTPAGFGAGSAYVFVRSGTVWTEQQKLLTSDAMPVESFGTGVSVSGDTLVVGARSGNSPAGTNTGSAYVFVRSGTVWTEQQKLFASDGADGDRFGVTVAVSGDTVVVGAPEDDNAAGFDAGAAYVFVRSGTTWTQQAKLMPADAAGADTFGNSVSVSGDTVVAGAPLDDNAGGSSAGSTYVFVRSGTVWTEQQKLLAPDGAAFDDFGRSVSLFGETLVGGAPGDDNGGGASAGSAYVFVRSGTVWTEQQKLLATDGSPVAFLGGSVSVFGDTAVIASGAEAAYVFVRSGTTWSEQQKLLAPGGVPDDQFGSSVSVSGDTVVAGAPSDDTPSGGTDAGSVHVFREAQADLGVTKTDGQTNAVPGLPVTYTITVANAGPTAVVGATVTDVVPAVLGGATWTCSASAGSACTASGSGSINDAVDLLAGGSATYTLTGTVDPAATGTLINTATATAPAGVDPNPANDSATDIDTLTPQTDLSIAKSDSADPVFPGDALRYDLTIANLGPSDATAVTVVDTLPGGVAFVSSVPGPPTCALAATTLTCGLGPLAAGGSATVTIDTIVNGSAGVLVNTASVSGAETDPAPGNNSAAESTGVVAAVGELAHGSTFLYDLAAQPGSAAGLDVFRISQKPYSSYEVVVDGTSGDIGTGAGPVLQRVAPDGVTVLQTSSAVGTGSSRSLRWSNPTSVAVDDQTVRVLSAQCGSDCGPDDVYRVRAYETSYSVPRFNNAGTQITVLVLSNPTDYPISGEAYFVVPSGTLVGVHGFSLSPKATLVLNTATVPGVNAISGALTVAHDGRYGDLSGKTVAVEPATGFSFDSPLVPRAN